MASNAVLTYREGRFEIPEELRKEWHLHDGAEVCVVYSSGGRVLLDTQQGDQIPKPDWRNLEGSLSHLSRSPNEVLEEERLRELELDVRP